MFAGLKVKIDENLRYRLNQIYTNKSIEPTKNQPIIKKIIYISIYGSKLERNAKIYLPLDSK